MPGTLAWLAVFAGTLALRATEPARATDDDLRIRGVFDSALPRTERQNSVRLVVHPHLGDFRERDYLRTGLGLRYGLTNRWEATVETDWYAAHGLKQASFLSESGFSSVHLGTKYWMGREWTGAWDCSVGADYVRPVGSPPPSVTDGLQHLAPYVTLSRALPDRPNWRVFFGVGYDFVATTAIPGLLSKNQLTDDAASVSTGFLWTRGPMTYTLEASYSTMHITKDSTRDLMTVRPGFVWVLPPSLTFGSKGKWLFGFALRAGRGVDGVDLGASAKVRVNFDFRRLLFGSKTN